MKLRQIFSQRRVIIIIGLLLISSVLFLCNLPYYYTEGFDGDADQSSGDTSTSSPDDIAIIDASTSAPATSADIANISATPVELKTDNLLTPPPDASTMSPLQPDGSTMSPLQPDGSTMSPLQPDGSTMTTIMPNMPMNLPVSMNQPIGAPDLTNNVAPQQIKKGVFKQPHEKI
jgi:hypothetical protein